MAKEREETQPLDKFACWMYKLYGTATLEERAIADYRDGFGPVHRRVLYAAYDLGLNHKSKLVKSARVVGDVLGKYHPHSDQAAYGSMVGLAHPWLSMPLIDGHGNWGSLTEPSNAAMRYTEARLTKFADEILFNKFYMPVVDYVPNFDGGLKEPNLLPALLPVILINGHFGIATGATAKIPACEFKSVLKLLKAAYEGAEIEPKLLYQNLKFRTSLGGAERKLAEKEAKIARMDTFRSPKGKAMLWSNMQYDEKKRVVTVTRFATSNMDTMLERIGAMEGVARAVNDSSASDAFGKLVVRLKNNMATKAYEKLLKKIDEELSQSISYNLNFTERYVDKEGSGQANLMNMSLTKMFSLWVKWRTELERKACSYWIKEDEKEISRLDLLAQAVDLIDFIVSLVKNEKLDEHQVYEAYAKKAKVTTESAKYVLGRPIISLRKLEKKKLAADRKAVMDHKDGLERRRKNPETFMVKQLEDFAKLEVLNG
jgi:DNA gyrase subunit A